MGICSTSSPGAAASACSSVTCAARASVRSGCASLVLGAVRAAAEDLDDPAEVIASVDRRIRRHLGDEDFVTACLIELTARGDYCVALAGHPAPFLIRADGQIAQLDAPPSPPLGLGATPQTSAGNLAVGDRLLLFTDGLTESRDSARAFIPVDRIVRHMTAGTVQDAVAATLRQLEGEAAGLNDDLALLAVERAVPAPRPAPGPHRSSSAILES